MIGTSKALSFTLYLFQNVHSLVLEVLRRVQHRHNSSHHLFRLITTIASQEQGILHTHTHTQGGVVKEGVGIGGVVCLP